MSRQGTPRQGPVPSNSDQYITVPQTPYSPPRARRHASGSSSRQPSYYRSRTPAPLLGRNSTADDVRTHNIGGGFGPYAHQAGAYNPAPTRRQNSARSAKYPQQSSTSVLSDKPAGLPTAQPYTTAAPSALLYDPKDTEIDFLHDPDPVRDARLDRECDPFSLRGWLNMAAIVAVCFGLITLFAGYPIISSFTDNKFVTLGGYNLGGVNSSGQVPDLPNMPSMIDSTTPKSAYKRTGWDKRSYNLVFSDEFNTDGRSFFPGDDPWWEAMDFHYWPTADLEWYAPDAVTTKGGNLVITMTEQLNHDLNFRSGMLQSWNKFCFSSGYVEVNLSLPNAPTQAGFWPGAWTMGNLGRAGYGATTEGTWPYSYDSCVDGDVGTFPNQLNHDNQPDPSITTGKTNGVLSSQPGQRLSACTCPGSDHPGPSVDRGRNAPEIDIIEAQIDVSRWQAQASQSLQVAPYNAGYNYTTSGATIYDPNQTIANTYKGGPYQQAVSAVADVPNTAYGGTGYTTVGFEYWGKRDDRKNSYVTWFVDGKPTWTVTADAIGADSTSMIGNRIISEEPMYIILNLGMAYNFQRQDYANMKFPAQMFVDYVRVYQRSGEENFSCSPKDYPTADYINDHINAYTNPNYTRWQDAGYRFPRNRLYDGC